MSEQPPTVVGPQPVDIRRAAVLLKHFNPDCVDLCGVNAVIDEAKSDQRGTQLLAAVAVVAYMLPADVRLGSPEGQGGLEQLIRDYSVKENSNDD